jgi:hypothetical protein
MKGRRPDGVRFEMRQAVALDTVMAGLQLLDIVGPAYAYERLVALGYAERLIPGDSKSEQ